MSEGPPYGEGQLAGDAAVGQLPFPVRLGGPDGLLAGGQGKRPPKLGQIGRSKRGYSKQLLPLMRTKRNIRHLHLYIAQGVKLLLYNKWETPHQIKEEKFQSELNAEADVQTKPKPEQSTRLCNPTGSMSNIRAGLQPHRCFIS
ncbi:hypothetical protein Q9233_010850 [Columba guinea]|nr:hypothetical protein Q9233_010850 [Columba guinea]